MGTQDIGRRQTHTTQKTKTTDVKQNATKRQMQEISRNNTISPGRLSSIIHEMVGFFLSINPQNKGHILKRSHLLANKR